MKVNLFLIAIYTFLSISCNQKDTLPAEAKRPIPIKLARFDQDFFSIDTLKMESEMAGLLQKYPDFFPTYLVAVLGINPADSLAPESIKSFINSYQPVYEKANASVKDQLSVLPVQMEEALQWMRYLVPSFKPDSPFVITPFIGPMDALESFSVGDYGDVRTSDGVGVALQFHLGENDPLYNQGMQNGVFYQYQVKRFLPEYMLINAMKNILEDYFPYKASGKPLVEEMVEKGKRIYLLKKLLPETSDSLLLGYTGKQLKGCKENEALIWQFFVKNDLLFSIDAVINQQYIKDGPKTPELGDDSPGYIGLFTGLRIVEAFMRKKGSLSIDELMRFPAEKLFRESGYRPG